MQNVLCDLCGEDQVRELAVIISARIVKCMQCGLGYVNPRESPDVLARIDEEYYGDGKIIEEVSHFNVGSTRLFLHTLKLISRCRPSGRLLDIGSGGGFFLKLAREYGYTAFGVEVDEDGCVVARRHGGLNIVHGTIFSAQFDTAFFDAVTLLNVLEHIESPSAVLKEVSRVLKPGGVLVVTVPNLLFGLVLLRCYDFVTTVHRVRDFRNDFGVFHVPEHHYFFTPATLRAMLAELGFQSIKVTNAIPINNPGFPVWTAFKYLSYWVSSVVTVAAAGALIPNYSITVTARRP